MLSTYRCGVFVGVLSLVFGLGSLIAQEASAQPALAESDRPILGLKKGYRLQDLDDLVLPMQPVIPRSAAIETRNDALSWFMVGRLFDAGHRNVPRTARDAFRKAVQIDPKAIEIYRNLVPLEFAFDNIDGAVRLAAKAVELDPDDYDILQMLARQAAMTGQLPEAIKYMEQAVKSPRIQKESPEFIILNKSLGTLYDTTGQKELAADCYEFLFDAIKTPEKFQMDSRGKNALLADPATKYEKIGEVLLDGKRLKLALEAFELAAKGSRAGAGNLSFYRAKVLYLTENYDEALTELQKYFEDKRTSKGRLPYQLLADILEKLKRSDELIGRLEKMAETNAQNAPVQFFLADQLANVNELERARAIYDTMLHNGGDASGYAGLARVLRKLQKSEELLDVLGRGFAKGDKSLVTLEPEVKAITEDKGLMTLLIEAGRTRAKSKQLKFDEALLLAKFAAALKDAETSSEFYRRAIALNRNPNKPNVLILIELADMLKTLRKYRQSVDTYKEILAMKQLNEVGQSLTYSSLAQALEFDSRTEEALEAIAVAIRIDDDKPGFRFYEAWIYSHAKRWEEAIQKFDQLMKDFPDQKELILLTQFSLSNLYVQKGEMLKGEEILEKVLESNPENTQVNNDLGYLWADQGKNLDQAEKMIRKALAAEPENGAYLDSLGWVLFKRGRFEEAIPYLQQATEKAMGSDATVWDHLGDAYLRLMQADKAIEKWQTALDHSEEDSVTDEQLNERLKDKLKQHGAQPRTKPADKGSP